MPELEFHRAPREPRFLEDYRTLAVEIGAPELVATFAHGAVLLGVGLTGDLPERPRSSRRRTLRAEEIAELRRVASVEERVWRLKKSPGAARGGYITLGQSADNDLVVPEYTVSTRHCAFGHDGFRYTVIDLMSLNGTRVDGRLVTPGEPTPLRDGVAIELGRLSLRVLYGESFVRRIARGHVSAA